MNLQTLISNSTGFLNSIVVLVAGFALLFFFWGLAKFILKSGDEKEIASGRNLMIWGTIAFFVMVSIWGLVNFLSSGLGIGVGELGV